jgi:hypothetical protein
MLLPYHVTIKLKYASQKRLKTSKQEGFSPLVRPFNVLEKGQFNKFIKTRELWVVKYLGTY